MFFKFYQTIWVVGFIGLIFLPGTAQAKAVLLPGLVEEARQQNPQIQAAHAKWKAAQRKITRVSWLEDPELSYSYFGDSIETRVGPQEHAFGVSQKLPVPQKLHYRAEVARQEAKATRQMYEAVVLDITTQVKEIYYELYWIQKAIEIAEQDKVLLEHFEQVARAHFTAHGGRQQDVSKAQVEVSQVIDRLLVLKQQATSVEARFDDLLNRQEETQWGRLPDFEIPNLTQARDDLLLLAEENQQALTAAEHRFKGRKAQVKLAQYRYLPDVTAGIKYINVGNGTTSTADDGKDAWMVTLGINLPIWEHALRANVQEAKAHADSAASELNSVRNQTEYWVTDAYVRWQTAKNLVDLYDVAVIPQARQALDAAESAYRAGEGDFLNLLDSERVWLNAQLTYWRAFSDAAKSAAILERAVGKTLTETTT